MLYGFLPSIDHLFLDWKKMKNWEPNRSYTQYVPQTATSLTHSYSTAFTTLLHSYTRWPAILYQLQVKQILLIMTCSTYKYCWTLFCEILIKGRLELYAVRYCVQDKAKYASAQNRWPTTITLQGCIKPKWDEMKCSSVHLVQERQQWFHPSKNYARYYLWPWSHTDTFSGPRGGL